MPSIYPKVVPKKVNHFSETFLCKSIMEEEERQTLENHEKPLTEKVRKKDERIVRDHIGWQ
jgi:hypothetical protein